MENTPEENISREDLLKEIEEQAHLKKSQEIIVDQEDVDLLCKAAKQQYNDKSFTVEDLVKNTMDSDLNDIEDETKNAILKIFDMAVAQGKFKKEGDKYSVVQEAQPKAEKVEEKQAEKPTQEKASEIAPPIEKKVEFKIPTSILDDIDILIKRNGGRGPALRLLRWDIADDTSVEEIVEKIKKAKESGVLLESEASSYLKRLGIEEINEVNAENVEAMMNNIKEAPKDLSDKIKQCDSFDELYDVLENSDGINGSTENYSFNYLIRQIENFRKNPEEINLLKITRSNGLRLAVERLQTKSVSDLPKKQENEAQKPETISSKYGIEKPNNPSIYPVLSSLTSGEFDNSIDDLMDCFEEMGPHTIEQNLDFYEDLSDKDKSEIKELFAYLTLRGKLAFENNGVYFMEPSFFRSKGLVVLEKTSNQSNTEKLPQGTKQTAETTEKKSETKKAEEQIVLPPPLPPVQFNINTPEALRDIETNLTNTRAEYARLLTEHKKIIREKKGVFKKILSDLGIEKQMPETGMSQELKDAEKDYILAKRKKSQNLFDQSETRKIAGDGSLLGLNESGDVAYTFNPKLIDQAEKEFQILQNKILEQMPPKEKGIFRKCSEKWQKIPLAGRIALFPVLIGVATAVAPVGGLALGASMAGFRLARGIGGVVGSKITGQLVDAVQSRLNEKKREDAMSKYGKEISFDNYEEKERELMSYFDKEEKKKQKQRLYKAAAMAIVGGAAGYGVGMAETNLEHALHPYSGAVRPDNIPKTAKPIVGDGIVRPKTPILDPKMNSIGGPKPSALSPEPPKIPQNIDVPKSTVPAINSNPEVINQTVVPKTSEPLVNGVKVDEQLKSVEGIYNHKPNVPQFDLKTTPLGTQQVGVSAGNIETPNEPELVPPEDVTIPELVEKKTFIDETGAEIPYSSTGATSGVEQTDFEQEYAKGLTKILEENKPVGATRINPDTFVGENGEAIPFRGQDVIAEGEAPKVSSVSEPTPPPPTLPDDGSVLSKTDIETSYAPSQDYTKSFELPIENKTYNVGVIDVAGRKEIWIENEKIAESIVSPNGNGGNLPQLLDKYQDGQRYAPIREIYSKAYSSFDGRSLPLGTPGREVMNVPFEKQGGMIQVFHGIGENKNAVQIYLNGKEIAKGLITEKGPKIDIFKNLKGGWFYADTVYERAFKFSKQLTKTFRLAK